MLFFSVSLLKPSKRPVAPHFFANLAASDCKLCQGLADSSNVCTLDIVLMYSFCFYYKPASFLNLFTISFVSTTGCFGETPIALEANPLFSLT
jgi:hypothetical protein